MCPLFSAGGEQDIKTSAGTGLEQEGRQSFAQSVPLTFFLVFPLETLLAYSLVFP